MRFLVLGAALLLAGSPVGAAPNPAEQSATAPTKGQTNSTSTKPDFDMSQMMAVFDKIFPAQPDPAPERLALGRIAVKALFPDGTYARLMDGMAQGIMDRVLNLSDADFGKTGSKGQQVDTTSWRQQAMKDDPHFEERMRITARVMTEEFGKIATIIEPRIREGLARSMARRFTERQLADINAFLATDSGKAFGSQSMAMWVDSDVLRGMISSFPEIMAAMPAAMKRVETETAHLPKPKPKPTPAASRRPKRAR